MSIEGEDVPEYKEGWETITRGGTQVVVRTSAINETYQAFETLVIYVSTLGTHSKTKLGTNPFELSGHNQHTRPQSHPALRLYSNAIPTSPKSLSDVQPQFEELLTVCSIRLSLSRPEKLALLRSIPARELTSKVMGLKMHTFRPVLDGAFFPTDLFDRFKNGDFAKEFERRRLELLIGEVRDEETIYRQTNPPDSLETLHLQVSNYYPSHVSDKLIDAYLTRKVHLPYAHPDPDPNIDAWKKVYGDIISDGQVRAPYRLLIDQLRHANVPLSRVHRYLISYRPSFMDRVAPATLGVGHAFDKPIWNISIMHGPTEEEEKAMRAWIADLREFVNRGLSEETGGKGYGTKEWEEYKVLAEDGKIEVRKDAKWAYLLEVGEIMAV
ncbi:alpha/beta-hydrolase [Stereum hirsutum FP-91666 SS1]|uniref:Alpha/beta-hydrolase n=1 Tax=Stereum hirsutum (strain FP-91666) TaxID=721885 RepID=R7RZX9_STEHR|nr:alpha/beta-hydrolase [Stereum hirsutum FP-91666 SS1]EIM79872.1 alpha/beta-hydrolase [Stereum hirsutum FP-91666 SS1]